MTTESGFSLRMLNRPSTWRLAASSVLVLLLVACGASDADSRGQPNEQPNEPASLTRAGFSEFTDDFSRDVEAAIADFTPSVAFQLALEAAMHFEPPIEYSDLLGEDSASLAPAAAINLPRGAWRGALNRHGFHDWQYVGPLPGPGELEFNNTFLLHDADAGAFVVHEVDYAVDWQNNGVPTGYLEGGWGYSFEYPHSFAASASSEGVGLVEMEADLETERVHYTCTFEDGIHEGEATLITDMLFNGTLGNPADILLRAADISFQTDTAAGMLVSDGEYSASYGDHSLALTWHAALAGRGGALDQYSDYVMCGSISGMEYDFSLGATLRLNASRLGFELALVTEGAAAEVDVDFRLLVDDALAFTISGTVDAESVDPVSGLTVRFSDEEVSLEEFLAETEATFGVDVYSMLQELPYYLRLVLSF